MTSIARTLVGVMLTCCSRVDERTVSPPEPATPTSTSGEVASTSTAHQPATGESPARQPLPDCREGQSAHSLGLGGLTSDQVRARFGPPLRQGTFRVEELQGEFFAPLANTYPTTEPKNRDVPLQQWTWTSGDCLLTVWFHDPKGTWVVLDDVYWHKDTEF